jgi:hypothetical protein
MPKESTILLYNSSVTGNAPSSGDLSLGEMAINTMDEKVFLKNLGGNILSLSQTKDLSGNFARRSEVVSSFNGATGAISYAPRLATTGVTGVAHFPSSDFAVSATGSVTLSNVARTNAANTFSARQTFSAGITTSNLFVSTGATFGGNISAPNIVTSVNTQVGDVSLLIENLDVVTTGRTTDYALVWDNGPETHVYKPISSLVGNYVTSVNGATGAVTDVAKTNTAQTFTGLQRFSNGISAAGATFDAGSTVRLSSLASHPQVDIGGGFYSGGNISGEAVNNVYFVAGQGGSGDFPAKPYIAFSNNSTDLGADITFQTLGGDIKFTANTDIDIVASDGNVNISSASGGIVIDPVTFVNIAGGVLYVDDTNNRVGINDTTPSMALCVNGGISGNSMIIAAGATFNSRANFAAGLTTANLFVTSGATFGTTINAPNIVSKWSVITADQTAEVNNGYLTNKGTLLTLTLPTTAAVGSMLRVSGMNAGLWKIAQNASQVIHFGKTDTTTGTGGFLLATQARDSVELVCCVANNEWNVISSVGNIDYT